MICFLTVNRSLPRRQGLAALLYRRHRRPLLAAAQNDLMAKAASGEIDTETKKQKLLDAYAEELKSKYPE
jgi:hypothetical protein